MDQMFCSNLLWKVRAEGRRGVCILLLTDLKWTESYFCSEWVLVKLSRRWYNAGRWKKCLFMQFESFFHFAEKKRTIPNILLFPSTTINFPLIWTNYRTLTVSCWINSYRLKIKTFGGYSNLDLHVQKNEVVTNFGWPCCNCFLFESYF